MGRRGKPRSVLSLKYGLDFAMQGAVRLSTMNHRKKVRQKPVDGCLLHGRVSRCSSKRKALHEQSDSGEGIDNMGYGIPLDRTPKSQNLDAKLALSAGLGGLLPAQKKHSLESVQMVVTPTPTLHFIKGSELTLRIPDRIPVLAAGGVGWLAINPQRHRRSLQRTPDCVMIVSRKV